MPPHPAQIDIDRTDPPSTDDDAGAGAVVSHGVDDLARVLDAGIDDLDGRHDIFGGAQHIG